MNSKMTQQIDVDKWQCNACMNLYATEAEAAGCPCPMHTHARTKITPIGNETGVLLQIEMNYGADWNNLKGLGYPSVQFVSQRHMNRLDALKQAFGCFLSSIPPRSLFFFGDDGHTELWNQHIAFQHCRLCGLPLSPWNWKACGLYDDEPNRICDKCHNEFEQFSQA